MRNDDIIRYYYKAKQYVISSGYSEEIDWQEDISNSCLSKTDVLREAAWVILSSGMKEKVIRGLFPKISAAFYHWSSLADIVVNEEKCFSEAMSVFGNKGKIKAIIYFADQLDNMDDAQLKNSIENDPIKYLSRFPYLGPATSLHLAKNLGIDVVKPDRHLVRIAEKAGFASPHVLCRSISQFTNDIISVVDIVLWRYATLNKNYLKEVVS